MIIEERLKEKNMTMYRLSKESGVPMTTVIDICSGKADISKCAAGTIYRIAKTLDVSMESIFESIDREDIEKRVSFEVFKSNECHRVKDLGDLKYVQIVLENNRIEELAEKKWYPEALYVLAMTDYLSRINNVPLCTRFENLRGQKLKETVYPSSIIALSMAMKSDEVMKEAYDNAIPEFKRFNIVENDIRCVV